MKLGIYVGSFNPVHKGHKYIMDYLINNKFVDKVIVIPTMNYWDKTDLVSIKDRINMLKFYEDENISVNDTLNNLKYTYLILNDLKKKYINDTLYLIIGADNIPKFHLWKNIDEILENKVIVIKRDDIDIEKYLNNFDNKDNFIIVKDFKRIDISSTNIRNNIEKNKDLLDEMVYKYIKINNLYEME